METCGKVSSFAPVRSLYSPFYPLSSLFDKPLYFFYRISITPHPSLSLRAPSQCVILREHFGFAQCKLRDRRISLRVNSVKGERSKLISLLKLWSLFRGCLKCSCPIYWATVPDKSGNYKNLGVKGFQNAQN